MALCLYRTDSAATPKLGLIAGDRVIDVAAGGGPASLTDVLTSTTAEARSRLEAIDTSGGIPLSSVQLAAPIDNQEVWAAGVTYLRSRDARMEESTQKSVYDLVYDAPRPEIFLKATPSRVKGPGESIAVRGDSTWDVPEPEFALVISSRGEIAGYTVANDVSSRSIEGENPLYLPQAKIYTASAALGPVIVPAWEWDAIGDRTIRLVIRRNQEVLFDGATSTNQIHRPFEELVSYLFRHNDFPYGAVLMTGTGIIPPSEFTLEHGDDVAITIDGIGTLQNLVIRL